MEIFVGRSGDGVELGLYGCPPLLRHQPLAPAHIISQLALHLITLLEPEVVVIMAQHLVALLLQW